MALFRILGLFQLLLNPKINYYAYKISPLCLIISKFNRVNNFCSFSKT